MMFIADDEVPQVSIVTTSNGGEAGLVKGLLFVSQSIVSQEDTVLSYSVSGTATEGSDYTALAGSLTIPAAAAHRGCHRQMERQSGA